MKIKEFIKENKYAIITIFILGVLTYLIKLTTYSFSIDTEAMLNNSEIQILTWISIQRIFVGNYEATGKNILLKGEAMEKTFFEWDKKTNIGSNNRIYGFFKAIGLEYKKTNDEEIVAEMQKEHEEKLIIEEQNYTIVNLKCLDK